jgi:hypothetical protein
MFKLKKTPRGYVANVSFFKTDNYVCTGTPWFYVIATSYPEGEYVLSLGIMDDDDVDIYDHDIAFDTKKELLRAFRYVRMELYDKRYLRSDNLYKTYADYVVPLRSYLTSQN